LKKKLIERCAEQKDVFYASFEDEISEDVKKHCFDMITLGFFERDKDAKCKGLV